MLIGELILKNEYAFEIFIYLISAALGINPKDIKKVMHKTAIRESEGSEIAQSIDTVSQKLEESREIINNALLEMDKQKELFEQIKAEAEVSQQIASMNKDQVAALNKLLEKTLDKQDKKAFPKTLFWNIFFCVLSAVLGAVFGLFLGKFLQ